MIATPPDESQVAPVALETEKHPEALTDASFRRCELRGEVVWEEEAYDLPFTD